MANRQRYTPRVVAAMVPDTPTSAAERRRLRELLAPLGEPTDRHIAALARAVSSCRESLGRDAAVKGMRKQTLKRLAQLENLTGKLFPAMVVDLDLDVSARLEDAFDVPRRRGPDLLELEDTANRILRLHAAAAAARHQLSREGAAGGGAAMMRCAICSGWRRASGERPAAN